MKTAPLVLVDLHARGLGEMVQEVCARRHVLPLEACGRSHVPAIVGARWEIWLYLRTALRWSSTMIADVFGVHHSSVLNALEKGVVA